MSAELADHQTAPRLQHLALAGKDQEQPAGVENGDSFMVCFLENGLTSHCHINDIYIDILYRTEL